MNRKTTVFGILLMGLGWSGCAFLEGVKGKFVHSKTEPEIVESMPEEVMISEPLPRPECGPLVVDLNQGTLNGLKGTEDDATIVDVLPCYNLRRIEGEGFACGIGYVYSQHHFYICTGRGYIELLPGFVISDSMNLFGKTSAELEARFGLPAKVAEWDGKEYYHFNVSWGVLVLLVSEAKGVEMVQMHHGRKAHQLPLCY